jgi:hypothetical protein
MAMNYYGSFARRHNNPLAALSFVGNANPMQSLWYDHDAEESSEELHHAFVRPRSEKEVVLRFVRRLGCAQALWMGRCASVIELVAQLR